MTYTASSALRQSFLDFFSARGHTVVKSASLVPHNDPTLMFTNAGMVPFKDVFVGQESRPYSRAASCQKCLRVSGKHNDLEEVGRTARHHTFFEMLGNFSFGDYFKEDAIAFAWQLLTREWGLDTRRLWITVFGGEGELAADDEARAIWKKVTGFSDERILGMGMKENFWAMGDTGPCGPCTEIHYDLGSGPATPADFETGRIVEIWNNVFMQFERLSTGELRPLPKPSVDTGMGLERLAAVVQGQTSNYHSDLFLPLLDSVASLVGKTYARGDSEDDVSMRVIADHARATAFLVADGVQPANDGRGYVMRRIMRRAIRHGKRLGLEQPFLHHVCERVVDVMGAAYPELEETKSLISKVAEVEEHAFRRTLDTGLKLLEDAIATAQQQGKHELSGAAVFRLYDTYGFPKDLTELLAKERGLGIDEDGFVQQMEEQKERSRGSEVGEAAVAGVYKELHGELGATTFIGYPHEDEPLQARTGRWRQGQRGGATYLEAEVCVRALVQNGHKVDAADEGTVEVVLEPTPFYGESGGQVGDKGLIEGDGDLQLEVEATHKPVNELTVARARLLSGRIGVGQKVWAGYQPEVRKQTRAHHSATHLLHGALRKVLGDHVKQAGSLVDPDHLRFDYAHFEAPSWTQLRTVEDDVNRRVEEAAPIQTLELPFAEAKERGAIAFFGDKYGDVVRMVAMGESIELCGGTHAKRTSDIDLALITREEAVASGVRRIEAEVGLAARRSTQKKSERLQLAARLLGGDTSAADAASEPALATVAKAVRTYDDLCRDLTAAGGKPVSWQPGAIVAPQLEQHFGFGQARTVRDLWQALGQMASAKAGEAEAIAERLRETDSGLLSAYAALLSANRENERRLEQAKRASLTREAGDLAGAAREVGGIKVLTARLDGSDAKALREVADTLRGKLGSAVVCLGSATDGKATLLVAVTKDLTQRLQAGKLVQQLAPIVGGKGGGKPELAQAGGSKPEALEQAFARLVELVGPN